MYRGPSLSLSEAYGRHWVFPPVKPTTFLGGRQFRFLNVSGQVHCAEDWNTPSKAKLWLYNLHYFDFINQTEYRSCMKAWLDRWINENPIGSGNGWEPYPTSLRIVNWIKFHLSGNPLTECQIQSLTNQANYLSQSLEYHLLGNHLLANAKAMFFSGVYFNKGISHKWLSRGRALLMKQIREQILPDGGHFERSPMYHSIILEDFLDLFNICGVYREDSNKELRDLLRECISKLLKWLRITIHEDGDVSYFNDSASGIAIQFDELCRYANQLGFQSKESISLSSYQLLRSTGFARLDCNTWCLLADIGSVGPRYQPGHAHAGTLSYELTHNKQRVIVNSGTSCYGLSNERVAQRSSAAHNSLVVDQSDSSEVWHSHRVARRSRVTDVEVNSDHGSLVLKAVQDGFKRLPCVGFHKRIWSLSKKRLEIIDIVEGKGSHSLDFFTHFYPGFKVKPMGSKASIFLENDCFGYVSQDPMVKMRVLESFYYPEFGARKKNETIHAKYEGDLPCRIKTTIHFGGSL